MNKFNKKKKKRVHRLVNKNFKVKIFQINSKIYNPTNIYYIDIINNFNNKKKKILKIWMNIIIKLIKIKYENRAKNQNQ